MDFEEYEELESISSAETVLEDASWQENVCLILRNNFMPQVLLEEFDQCETKSIFECCEGLWNLRILSCFKDRSSLSCLDGFTTLWCLKRIASPSGTLCCLDHRCKTAALSSYMVRMASNFSMFEVFVPRAERMSSIILIEGEKYIAWEGTDNEEEGMVMVDFFRLILYEE